MKILVDKEIINTEHLEQLGEIIHLHSTGLINFDDYLEEATAAVYKEYVDTGADMVVLLDSKLAKKLKQEGVPCIIDIKEENGSI